MSILMWRAQLSAKQSNLIFIYHITSYYIIGIVRSDLFCPILIIIYSNLSHYT